ncbi:MAG: hypothetical protein JOY67_21250 [Hyphomicrobiales bacterium]|nr:hypothetical protein [Hyphomicrobiales bacterium]MBV9115346.1 hypothetical protein [Hyphomicrobiales bacterium]MBV9519050.1 hypothetical protein [Hyphomicrobiales bacterium]
MRTRAKWSRWGWGRGEGYSLEIGGAFRCSVVLKPASGNEPASYSASINAMECGRCGDRESAMRMVEQRLEADMARILRDWTVYQALKALNGDQVPRIALHPRKR